jgi:hypothetical protein
MIGEPVESKPNSSPPKIRLATPDVTKLAKVSKIAQIDIHIKNNKVDTVNQFSIQLPYFEEFGEVNRAARLSASERGGDSWEKAMTWAAE